MKLTTLTTITGLALASMAQAGEEISAKGAISPLAPPCLWTWFAGGSGGYVSGDWDEEIYTLHVGTERKCAGDSCSHAFYLEVGYTEKDFSEIERVNTMDYKRLVQQQNIKTDINIEVIPITLNYKYECELSGNLNWYVGAGAGIALVDLEVDSGGSSDSDDDTAFYAHIFAGLVYNVSERFEIFGGARYIFMGDVFGEESPLDGDVHYELGGRYNF